MIWCVGVGPGHLDFLTRIGQELIEQADVVVGFSAVVDLIRSLVNPNGRIITIGYKDQVERLDEVARLHRAGANCVVVFMGDLHFSGFQFLERVERACQHRVETIPGISSVQILASRCHVCFDETTFITFHRRGDIGPFQEHLVHVLEDNRNAIVIPRPWDFMPAAVAKLLLARGVSPDHPTEVWEHLTQSEAAWKGVLGGCLSEFSDMSIMLIRAQNPLPTQLVGDTDTPSRCEPPSLFDASTKTEGRAVTKRPRNAGKSRSGELRLST
ncbi:MAG TPA: cobalt-precorrin-7 (C(5))-methyltransferase [Chthoniobacterales bacterium]|nr:cobalt-precorrin-7 (C(5))-methyltransferase [Chthoniobacterales bacterium]